MDFNKYFAKAQNSSFYLMLLNRVLLRFIPFNGPHKILITGITDNSTTIKLPYRKKNMNHLKGLHACALATLAEYTAGLTLIRKLSSEKYRLILKKIEVDYFFQGKTDASATFVVEDEWLKKNVLTPLSEREKIETWCEVKVYDANDNHLATGKTLWQIKDWEAVKTKV